MNPLLVILGLIGLITLTLTSPTTAALDSFQTRELSTRNKDGVHCCWSNQRGWSMGESSYLQDAAQALTKLGGKNGVYGHKCIQISCQGNMEIVLCNDNDYYINPDAEYLATYALDILNECHLFEGHSDASYGTYYTCGQAFDTDHYNIIVKKPDSGWC